LTLRIGLIAGIIGTFVGATLAFFSAYYGGTVRHHHPRHCRHRFDSPRADGADPDRDESQGWARHQSDGADRRLAGLAVSGAHHPLAGADHQGAGLRPDRPPVGRGWTGDHRQRTAAEPAAVHGRLAHRLGVVRDSGVDRSGGAGARTDRISGPRHDAVLGCCTTPRSSTLVVVVGAADCGDRGAIHRLFLVTVGLDEIANPRLRRQV